jgi:hypothetical protein
MSIRYVRGDLFAAPVQALVIPVNCCGAANTGLALQCKQRYPCWFEEYRAICHDHLIWPGYPVLHSLKITTKNPVERHQAAIGANLSHARRFIAPDHTRRSIVLAHTDRSIAPDHTRHSIAPGGGTLTATAMDRWIVDFPTKEHWWLPSRLLHIEIGLLNLATLCQNHRLTGMALPMLGCCDEGLCWEQVQPLIEECLSPLAMPIYIYIDDCYTLSFFSPTQFTTQCDAKHDKNDDDQNSPRKSAQGSQH